MKMSRNTARFGPLVQLALACLLWFGLTVVFLSSRAATEHSSATSVLSHFNGARFVFADLDGDRKPDLALVEMQSQLSNKANYSIRLQLSHGGESAIGVLAPFGGLRIAARDVNGDDNVDLIVTSILDAHFVEVLLNDGRGNFSVAASGDFPEFESETQESLNSPSGPRADQATLLIVRTSFGERAPSGYAYDQDRSMDSCPLAKNRAALRRRARRCFGRSPPLTVSLS